MIIDANNLILGRMGAYVAKQALLGEKIDIIHWADDPAVLVKNALSPAQISKVITDDAAHAMEVVVPDDQLSLAIGKKGQNVRLAAKLTGWKIDITTETDARGEAISPDEALRKAVLAAGIKEAIDEKRSAGIKVLEGIGDKTVEKLNSAGFDTVGDIMRTTAEQLERIEGIGKKKAEAIIEAAGKYMKDSTEEKE